MTGEPTTWGVFHDLRAGGRRARVLRLTVAGAPATAKAADVLELLERAGEGPRFAEGGVPWANHSVLPERRWPAVLEAGGRVERRRWAELEGVQTPRVVTLRLPPATWAAVTIAAERAGVPMQAWATGVLERAARAKATAGPAKRAAKGPAPKAAASSSARAAGSARATPAKAKAPAKATPARRAPRSGPSSSAAPKAAKGAARGKAAGRSGPSSLRAKAAPAKRTAKAPSGPGA